jgi:hypothetical protein
MTDMTDMMALSREGKSKWRKSGVQKKTDMTDMMALSREGKSKWRKSGVQKVWCSKLSTFKVFRHASRHGCTDVLDTGCVVGGDCSCFLVLPAAGGRRDMGTISDNDNARLRTQPVPKVGSRTPGGGESAHLDAPQTHLTSASLIQLLQRRGWRVARSGPAGPVGAVHGQQRRLGVRRALCDCPQQKKLHLTRAHFSDPHFRSYKATHALTHARTHLHLWSTMC